MKKINGLEWGMYCDLYICYRDVLFKKTIILGMKKGLLCRPVMYLLNMSGMGTIIKALTRTLKL